ncbi:MAG: substrate-binding domain-containing protein [Candidatus Velthaea sp.]
MRPLELYPGPGLFCPDCGERLVPLRAADADPLEVGVPAPEAPRIRFGQMRALVAVAALSFAVGSAAVVLHSTAFGDAAKPVHVCRSTAAVRLADDVVRAYAAKSGTPAARFVMASAPPCDVRFTTAAGGTRGDAIAADGLVAIVNPLNPVGALSAAQLRQIFSGAIRDWSQVGGRRGAIRAMLPAPGTDEARALAASLLRGVDVPASVRRLPSSADVSRAVTGPAAHGAIGLAAFSAAVPAKVLAVAKHPPPSTLSIADRRYPYVLALVVDQDLRADKAAAGLVAYARSPDAGAVIARDGLVPHETP